MAAAGLEKHKLTSLKLSYATDFSQHKHAHPIFFWFTLSAKNEVILCLGYSFSQIDFFCMAHWGHQGLAKFKSWKQKARKARKAKTVMNYMVDTSIQ